MSRSHHNAYSQQQHHHTHQNSWFMSPNIVNSLFCSPGNNSSGNFNNAFLNSSNINNHLTNLLNAQHHFMPRNQLSNSQSHSNSSQSVIGGNTFSSHYQGNHQSFTSQPYSSIFSLNNAYSNSNTGSNNRFIAGQNNHHYQNSSSYARSMHSNRMSRGNIDFNSIIPEQNHSRRYQSGLNSNGPLISYPGSVANSKSMNINGDFNVYNDNSNSTRSTSSNFSFYQNKESKSLNNNNNFNSNMKYNAWSKLSNNETDDIKGSTSDLSSNSKYGPKHQQVKGMENIKLDNEGVHSNYIQFTGMIPKQSPSVITNYDSFPDENQKNSSLNRRDNVDWTNNYSKLNSKQHNTNLEVYDNPNSIKSKKSPISKITEPEFAINQKKGSVKFLLNVDEDELIYYDDDIVEIARFETENKKEESSLIEDKKYDNEVINSVGNEIPKIDEKYLSTLSDSENRYECDENKKKKQHNKENSLGNNPESITSIHTFCGPCTGQPISCSNMEFANSEGNFNAHQQHIVNSSPNSSSFTNSNLISGIPPSNMFAYPSQIIPNFAMNCPLLSNPGNNMMAATYIAAALSGSHPSMVSNPNSKCNMFRHDSLAFNSNSYHDIVSSKLWQYYITNRQTEAMYVRKVQLRNALHMVMSYVFESN